MVKLWEQIGSSRSLCEKCKNNYNTRGENYKSHKVSIYEGKGYERKKLHAYRNLDGDYAKKKKQKTKNDLPGLKIWIDFVFVVTEGTMV